MYNKINYLALTLLTYNIMAGPRRGEKPLEPHDYDVKVASPTGRKKIKAAIDAGKNTGAEEAKKALAAELETVGNTAENPALEESEAVENEDIPETAEEAEINPEELAEEVSDGLVNNPDLPEDLQAELAAHKDEIDRTVKFHLKGAKDLALGFATGVGGAILIKTAAAFLLRTVGKRALDIGAPGLGAAVGGLVGAGYEGTRAYIYEGKRINTAAAVQERWEKRANMAPIDQVKLYLAAHHALVEGKYTGGEAQFKSLRASLDAVDLATIVSEKEWAEQSEAFTKLGSLADIRNAAHREALLQDEDNKEILAKLQKDYGKGKRDKWKIAGAALKGGAIGAVGGVIGGYVGEKAVAWLGWGGEAAASTTEAAKKVTAAATKEAATTQNELTTQMHKHVWGTVKQWYLDHGIPKGKVTDKLINEGVKKITEHNPAVDLANVPHDQLQNLVQVKAWPNAHLAKDLAYKYLDTKMQEGTLLHHMERLIGVAKDQGINMVGSTATNAAETATSTATTTAAETGTNTAAQTIVESGAHAIKELAKEAPSDEGYKKFVYGLGVVVPATVIGGIAIAKYKSRKRKNAAKENGGGDPGEESKAQDTVTENDNQDLLDGLDEDYIKIPLKHAANESKVKEEPETPTEDKQKKGILNFLNSPVGQIIDKGAGKLRERLKNKETKASEEFIKILKEKEAPFKEIFGQDFVFKYSSEDKAENFMIPENLAELDVIMPFLKHYAGELKEGGVENITFTLSKETKLATSNDGVSILKIDLSKGYEANRDAILAIIRGLEADEPFKEEKESLIEEAKNIGITGGENINRWVNLMNNSNRGPMWTALGNGTPGVQAELRKQLNWQKTNSSQPVVKVLSRLISDFNSDPTASMHSLIKELGKLAPKAEELALKSLPKEEVNAFNNRSAYEKVNGALPQAENDGLERSDANLIWDVFRKDEKNPEDIMNCFAAIYETMSKHYTTDEAKPSVEINIPGSLITLLNELRKIDPKHGLENTAKDTKLTPAGKEAYEKFKDSQRTRYLRRNRNK